MTDYGMITKSGDFTKMKMRLCFYGVMLTAAVYAASVSETSNTFSMGVSGIKGNQPMPNKPGLITFSTKTPGEILIGLNNPPQDADNAAIRIYDLKGKLLTSFELDRDNAAILRIEDYAMGVHIVEAELPLAKFKKKLLILK